MKLPYWEGIGHLALGIPDGDYPNEIPRTGNKVFLVRII